jgi:hypothetical protein
MPFLIAPSPGPSTIPQITGMTLGSKTQGKGDANSLATLLLHFEVCP